MHMVVIVEIHCYNYRRMQSLKEMEEEAHSTGQTVMEHCH